ncbi:MAG: glucose-1-phosphate adenylyltransferase subunit GlgD [Fusicatenibacter sp.]|nr:glucose-1-phosphate adenylyltransferase subunit GlgD [Fusicatenibacter sp.]
MVNSNADALGIIFPNSYDDQVPDLVSERLMASIPFASRYRMVDFILSSMVNCGIGNVSIVVRKNYHSLMDHLGSGREWDLARKKGGLNIVPPYSEKMITVYNGRVEALASLLDFLKWQKEKYVVLSDANIAVNFDFKDMLNAHIANGADVTVAYAKQEIPDGVRNSYHKTKDLYYTLSIEDGRVTKIYINPEDEGVQNMSMNIYILERELLMDLINTAFVRGYAYFERDILAPQLDKLNVQAYEFGGYFARVCDMKSYFDENMKLLEEENLDALFSGNPIYTKIRDDNPTRYINGSRAKNAMVADGCVIEGEIENSVLFRGVKVAKGAKVKNCVLMQDTVIEAGAQIEYVISDKYVTVTEGKEVKGTDTFPVFIAKDQTV